MSDPLSTKQNVHARWLRETAEELRQTDDHRLANTCEQAAREIEAIEAHRDALLEARSPVEPPARNFRGVGQLERDGYIPAGSAAEREAQGETTAVHPDTARLDWYEQAHGLHTSLEILYVVDGYHLTSLYDGNDVGASWEGETLRAAIDTAMKVSPVTTGDRNGT